MKKIASIVLMLWAGLSLSAHNPLSARFELKLDRPVSVFVAAFSQDGLNEALQKWCSDTDLNALTPTEYKELVVQYVKDHTQLLVDGQLLQLGAGGIKLGSHETDMRFVVKDLPATPKQVYARITNGFENQGHESIFWVTGRGIEERSILREQNNFSAIMKL